MEVWKIFTFIVKPTQDIKWIVRKETLVVQGVGE